MTYVMRYGFIFFLFACMACPKHRPVVQKEGDTQLVESKKIGFNMLGHENECVSAREDVVCTMSIEPGDLFAEACKEKGFNVVKCGCHNYLCDKNIIEISRKEKRNLVVFCWCSLSRREGVLLRAMAG